MPIKTYRPVTSTRRFQTTLVTDDITTNQPHKPLTEPKQRTGGRRNSGDITSWHRGGGHKRKLRLIDFKRYILQPDGLKVGQKVVSGPEADILVGNALPLKNIPPGTTIHNIELRPGKGAQMVRSAGGSAQLVAKEGDY